MTVVVIFYFFISCIHNNNDIADKKTVLMICILCIEMVHITRM